jgi:biopolymer transport protein ExbD
MQFGFPKKPRREPVQPNLTPMLDIFSILTLFLITSAVFGSSSVEVLESIKLPLSISKNQIQKAPQISISDEGISAPFLKIKYKIDPFFPENRNQPAALKLKQEIRKYVRSVANDPNQTFPTLVVVADRSLSYEYLYDVISLFREAGFQKLSFVAQDQESQ